MAPVLTSLTVSRNFIVLDFDSDLDLSFLGNPFELAQVRGRFSLQISGVARSFSALTGSLAQPRRLVLTYTGAPAASDQRLLLDYSDPFGNDTSGVVQDRFGDDLRTFSRHAETLTSDLNVFSLAEGYPTCC